MSGPGPREDTRAPRASPPPAPACPGSETGIRAVRPTLGSSRVAAAWPASGGLRVSSRPQPLSRPLLLLAGPVHPILIGPCFDRRWP